MLKKRILASSLASVMALSSVSVVAFADETATAEYGEVVTRPELKEHLKTYDKLVKGDIKNYGSVQALRFQEAYDHATYVAYNVDDDAKTDEKNVIAAYQMVKTVAEKLQQFTNEQLKELIAQWKSVYDRNNILNAEIRDNIYDPATFAKFKAAYQAAEAVVNVDDLMMVTDAYINLDEAANALEPNRLTPVSKEDFRALIRQYETMISQFSKYETWRRGTVSKDPKTGTAYAAGLYLSKAEYVTWGELQAIVTGASTNAIVSKKVAIDRTSTATAKNDTKMNETSPKTWIANGGDTVKGTLYTKSKAFDDFKSAFKTTDTAIKAAYDAAKEAIDVFSTWKPIDADITAQNEAAKTLNKYRIKLASDFEGTLAQTLVSTSIAGLKFGSTATAGLAYTAPTATSLATLKGVAGAEAGGCYLRIDSGTDTIQLINGAYDPTDYNTTPATFDSKTHKSYTVKIVDGEDYLKYIPVRAASITTSVADCTDKKVAKVQDALFMLEKYQAAAALASPTATDWDTAYKAEQGSGDPFDSVKELDENKTVTQASGGLREYTFINRYLAYALDDLYPAEAGADVHTRTEVRAKVQEAYDLIDKTGSSNIFAAKNNALALARELAVEWLREADKDLLYKDNDAAHGTFNGKTATEVYHTLAHAAAGTYDLLKAELDKYPISYGEIVMTIAEVNEKVEDEVYGESVKKAVDEVSYWMSVIKASDFGNEAYTNERAVNAYNRLRCDAGANSSEKALKTALENLKKVIAEADSTTGTKGDLTGDNKVNVMDATQLLKEIASGKKFTAEEIAVRDLNGDKNVNVLDAVEILKIIAKG